MQNEYYRDFFNRVQVDRTILNNAESFEEHTKRLGKVGSRHISLGLDIMPIVCGGVFKGTMCQTTLCAFNSNSNA